MRVKSMLHAVYSFSEEAILISFKFQMTFKFLQKLRW